MRVARRSLWGRLPVGRLRRPEPFPGPWPLAPGPCWKALALLFLAATATWSQSQPIAFSHKIHAGQYKLECLFCHSGARRSATAGVPSLQLCMGCHRMAAVSKPEIQRLRAYWDKKTPVPWTKVVKEPDYVFFNHSPHILRGVRCQHCHGPVETMTEVRLDHTLSMTYCANCHRQNKVSIDCYTCHR